MRTTREKTPLLYSAEHTFEIGGSKIVRESADDKAVVFAAGITVHEAVKAYEELKNQNIMIAIVDLYSVKPIDKQRIIAQAKKAGHVIIAEDHYPADGLGEAVKDVLVTSTREFTKLPSVTHLCVQAIPHSGSPAELLEYEEIDAQAIVKAVKHGL